MAKFNKKLTGMKDGSMFNMCEIYVRRKGDFIEFETDPVFCEKTGKWVDVVFNVKAPVYGEDPEDFLSRVKDATPHSDASRGVNQCLIANDYIKLSKLEKKRGSKFARRFLGDDYDHYDD